MIVQRTKEGKAIAKTNPYFQKRKNKKYSFNQNNRTRQMNKTITCANVVTIIGIVRLALKQINK